ncbi:MAG: carbon-nitrogen hydrolase family protein [bacterium]|nr:carbon-nitrogen hydrolase family protein [bacterium]
MPYDIRSLFGCADRIVIPYPLTNEERWHNLNFKTITPWAVEPRAASKTGKLGDGRVTTSGNGTRTCCGGWQLDYVDVQPGQTYRFEVAVDTEDIAWVRDTLVCYGKWAHPETIKNPKGPIQHDFLFVRPTGANRYVFSGEFTAPDDAHHLTLYYVFRWTAAGSATWLMPVIVPVETPAVPSPVRVCVVTGKAEDRPDQLGSATANIQYYSDLCRKAINTCQPNLLVLPEIALQWGVKGSRLDHAISVPGPETELFGKIAREGRTHLVIGAHEKRREATYNSAILLDPDGGVVGSYRKVHLAEGGEWLCEITPGSDFSVFDTGIGRIGFNICMDSSAAESSRMIGLHGADFLVLPIMGDLRGNSDFDGKWDFDPDKWRAIMRVRAMDQKLCMVVARNRSQGSCIVNSRGDVLAWNEGDQDCIFAEVQPRDFFRMRGFCQTRLNWYQRRPHLYADYTDTDNYGPF